MASHVVLKEQLVEMGFEEKLIHGALRLLKDKATLETVIESIENGTAEIEAAKLDSTPENESEKKEITPEEFEARKKAMELKIKQRRMEIEEKEKEAERQREIQRRQDGKGMAKVREEIDKIQRDKLAENLKREKMADKEARDAILRKIEQDKAERRAKTAGPAGAPSAAPATSLPATVSRPAANASADGKTKLAIRLLDGSTLVQEFDAKEVLSSVRAYIVTQKNITHNITFAMPPLPAFSNEDMEKPLHALGLVPNARLQVVKRN